MARRRLGPAQFASAPTGTAETPAAAPEVKSAFPGAPGMAPIARIAGQSASEAALASLAEDVARARAEGRLVQALPLEAIDEHHLVRDRLDPSARAEGAGGQDDRPDEEMAALETSLAQRGQQVPIEVVDLDPGQGAVHGPGRYGLISGWRRLTALRRLARAEPDRFGTVLAVLRRPETAAEAYRAMVEENEIRVGLSYYERARIVARSVGQGVFDSESAALSTLFATASRAKRSKIGSFVKIHDALEDRLRFPAAIPERLGLQLARAVEDAGLRRRLRDRLRKSPAADSGGRDRGAGAGAGRSRGPGRGRAIRSPGGRRGGGCAGQWAGDRAGHPPRRRARPAGAVGRRRDRGAGSRPACLAGPPQLSRGGPARGAA